MLTKISVCTGYLWLFPGKKNKIFCYAMIGYSILYGVALFFAHVFQCNPVSVFWKEPFDPGTICINKLALYVTAATLNSLGDLLIYLWPVWFLFRLQMPLKHRVGLIILFSFGCCVLTASLMRIAYLPASLQSIDIFYNSARLHLISLVEETIGIICGCLPAAKVLLKHAFPAVFGSIDSPLSTVNTKRASAYSEYRRSAVLEQTTKNGGLGDVEAWGEEIRDVEVLSAVLNMEPYFKARNIAVRAGSLQHLTDYESKHWN
ncbi:hypothetical protein GTA08_BOTSDO07354 [Botryosphaeria dothidea]|uniref:Rhodopsin domain-containing protein n=1 Tax=Botryosphaeria dothidea TaxID=55169 RepID=A0A8H4N133_9PEZI|nr:hypothetical protein GTA08_BOTSDO07354 [Botryosphaeria dothidea]